MNLVRICLVVAGLCFMASVATGSIIYVPDDSTTIQAAVSGALNGDTIYVRPGTYEGPDNRDIDFGGKLISLISLWGPDSTTIIVRDTGDALYSRGFYFHNHEDSNAVVVGFTLTRANDAGSFEWAGGIYCDSSSPTIRNCVFSQIAYSGAFYCKASSPRIDNCSFLYNTTGASAWKGNGETDGKAIWPDGAALCCDSGSSMYVSDCYFASNMGDEQMGGAIACIASSLVLDSCIFSSNHAYEAGGALYCTDCSTVEITGCTFTSNSVIYGGGGAISVSASSVKIDSCTFDGNQCYASGASGGAIACGFADSLDISSCTFSYNDAERMGGALALVGLSSLKVDDCFFYNNTSTYGAGAVGCGSGVKGDFTDCRFERNITFEDFGGAVICNRCSPVFSHCSFTGNEARSLHGGAIFCDSASPVFSHCLMARNMASYDDGWGGALYCCDGGCPVLSNCTLAGNFAMEGSAVYVSSNAACSLSACIVAFSRGPVLVHCWEGNVVLSCTDVYGNEGGDWTGCIADQYGQNGNLYADPMFYDTTRADFHLLPSSPCLADSNSCGVLIGAYDVQVPPQIVSIDPPLNVSGLPTNQQISVVFDMDMDPASFNSTTFRVHASMTGPHSGAIVYDSSSRTVTFTPHRRFVSGEQVSVFISTNVSGLAGGHLLESCSWSFTIGATGGGVYMVQDSIYAIGFYPSEIMAVDVNRDRAPDIIVASADEPYAVVALNDGDGTFTIKGTHSTGGIVQSLAAGDFDLDGDIDLVFGNDSGNVVFFGGNGTGYFHQDTVVNTGSLGIPTMSVADLDYDGDLDILAASILVGGYHGVAMWKNQGYPKFSAAWSKSTSGYEPKDIRIGDLDNDGWLDFGLVNSNSDNLAALWGKGFDNGLTLGLQDAPVGLVAGDVNGDRLIDFVSAGGSGRPWLSVVLNNGNRNLAVVSTYDLYGNAGVYDVVAADFDGDRDLDVGVMYPSSVYQIDFDIMLNDGDGNFSLGFSWSTDSLQRLCVADFDLDGDMDLAGTHSGLDAGVFVYRNVIRPEVFSTSPEANSVEARPDDVITVTFNAPMDETTINNQTFVVRGNQSGRHRGSIAYSEPTRTATFEPYDDFLIGEVVEVVLTNDIESVEGIALSSHSWSFRTAASSGTAAFSVDVVDTLGYIYAICAADFDNDGYPDLAAGGESDSLWIYHNAGNGTFTRQTAAAAPYMKVLVTADMDGDSLIDLISAGGNTLSVWPDVGDGVSLRDSAYGVIGSAVSVAASDLTGDGCVDLVVAGDKTTDTVSFLLNDGDGDLRPFCAMEEDIDVQAVLVTDILRPYYEPNIVTAGSNVVSVSNHCLCSDPPYVATYTASGLMTAAVAADITGDGWVDVCAVTGDSPAKAVVFRNDGTGVFEDPDYYVVGEWSHSLAVADLDGDGDLDLAVPGSQSCDVTVLLNSGGGFVIDTAYSVGYEPWDIVAADFDRDGDIDLATANYQSKDITVLWNLDRPDFTELPNPSQSSAGRACSLSVQVGGSPDEVSLVFRVGGEPSWDTVAMDLAEETYVGVIPADSLGPRGIEYYFHAVVAGRGWTLPVDSAEHHPYWLQVELENETGPDWPSHAWSMVGFPYDIDPAADELADVFGDELGVPSDTTWRVGRWSPQTASYQTNSAVGAIERKKGYWLCMAEGAAVGADGLSAVPDTSQLIGGLYYDTIALEPGWNQIAAPFAFPVAWADRIAEPGIQSVAWAYESGTGSQTSYITVDNLEPFCGYWVKNDSADNKVLRLPYRSAGSAGSAGAASRTPLANAENSWRLTLSLESSHTADRVNMVGVEPDASDGADRYDFSEPPPFDKYVSLAFMRTESDSHRELLAGDIRSDSATGWLFDMLVRGNTGEAAHLSMADCEDLSEHLQVYLVDPESGSAYRLHPDRRLILPQVPTVSGVVYQLAVGSEAFVRDLNATPTTMPDDFALDQNYPNPFNPSTSIRFALPAPQRVRLDVLNILGQRVVTLIDRQLSAGVHTILWDGRNGDGEPVASGVYFYRLDTDGFAASRKMILLK